MAGRGLSHPHRLFRKPRQPAAAAKLVSAAKAANPNVTYICDPVMGDLGGLYIPPETAAGIRDELIPLADIATPNRYEFAVDGRKRLGEQSGDHGSRIVARSPRMLVTSAVPMMAGGTGNLLLSGRSAILAEHRLIDNPPNAW